MHIFRGHKQALACAEELAQYDTRLYDAMDFNPKVQDFDMGLVRIIKHPYKRLWAVCTHMVGKSEAIYFMDGGQ